MTAQPAKSRRMAREPGCVPGAEAPVAPTVRAPSKLDQVEALLNAPGGASVAEIMTATGWQQHSVRGAMAGALKKRRLTITSDKLDGTRRYFATKPA